MTSAERTRVLDEQLRKGYEVFDGIILDERERNQTDRNANPGGFGRVGDGSSESGGSAGAAGRPQTLPANGSATGPQVIAQSSTSAAPSGASFPPPDDIPSGRDDDVVARQLREAATKEPDPELREALWEEYRNYTGISEQ